MFRLFELIYDNFDQIVHCITVAYLLILGVLATLWPSRPRIGDRGPNDQDWSI